jgi:glycerol dehydrogenase-like iron-containing ADH family enzyme
MSVWPLPRITFRELSSIDEKRPVALLTSEDTWAVLSSQINLPVMIQAEPERYDRDLFEYLANHLPTQVQAVYAIGEGAVVEAGKLIAARNDKPLIVVPTALTSDRMLTAFALVEEDVDGYARLVWQEAVPPNEIIIDWGFIQSAPQERRGAGIVDVLAIVNGLLDWRYAAQRGKNPSDERFAPWAASVAAGLASQAIKGAAAIGQGNAESLDMLLDLLMMIVQLNNSLNHTRAQQGGAYFLAQILAKTGDPFLSHAERLGPCMLFLSALHGQDPSALRDALTQAGVPLDHLRVTDLRMVLDDLPNHLAYYNFPYSILDELEPGSEQVTKALEAAGLAVREETWEMPAIPGLTDIASPVEEAPLSAAAPAADSSPAPTVTDSASAPASEGDTGDTPDAPGSELPFG